MNCTECVKACVDHDVFYLVQQYAINKNCYDVTKREIYQYECDLIKQELQTLAYTEDIEFLNYMPLDQIVQKMNVYHSNKRRVRNRLVQRVNLFLSKANDYYGVYFVTLTFNDDYLHVHNYEDTRRDVREFVKKYSQYYILNKDYGELKDRLHFHGVVVLKRTCENKDSDFNTEYNDNFGFCNLQLCNENSTALTLYIEKLTFHALKLTTKKEYREHIIYSRLPQSDREELNKFYALKNTKLKCRKVYISVGGIKREIK